MPVAEVGPLREDVPVAVSREESVPVVLTESVTLTVEENVKSEEAVAEYVNEAVALWELVSVDSAV